MRGLGGGRPIHSQGLSIDSSRERKHEGPYLRCCKCGGRRLRIGPVASIQPRLTFGVLRSAYARISSALTADPKLHTHWAYALDIDPTRENELARLLVADALAANPDGAILYSTTRTARMVGAAGALDDPPPSAVLDTFRNVCGDFSGRTKA
jgi:hypothetical protein